MTDTDALTERIARALFEKYEMDITWDATLGFPAMRSWYLDAAPAVLPLIAAEVQAAKAAAWDEGYEAGMLDTYRLGRDMDLTITPAPNPYRETGDRA